MTDGTHTPPSPAWLARVLLTLADLYSAALLGYFVLRLAAGPRLGLVALVSNVIHWLLLPAFPLLVLMLVLRRWRRAVLAAGLVAAFAGLFGGLFWPLGRGQPGCGPSALGCRTVTVMTFNTGSDLADPAALAGAIQASGADVVGLVELSARQAATFEVALAADYPYRSLHGLGFLGVGLLSRYPIVDTELVYPQLEYMPYILATLDVDGAPLTIIVYHLKPPTLVLRVPGLRYGEWRLDATLIPTAVQKAPCAILGDFNTTDQSATHREMAHAGLRDAWRVAGRGFGVTYPARRGGERRIPLNRLVRIDYVWVTGEIGVQAVRVGPAAGSDHYPVIAELAWQAASQP